MKKNQYSTFIGSKTLKQFISVLLTAMILICCVFSLAEGTEEVDAKGLDACSIVMDLNGTHYEGNQTNFEAKYDAITECINAAFTLKDCPVYMWQFFWPYECEIGTVLPVNFEVGTTYTIYAKKGSPAGADPTEGLTLYLADKFSDSRKELNCGHFMMAQYDSAPDDYFSFTVVRFEPVDESEEQYLIEVHFEGEMYSKNNKKHILIQNGAFLTYFVPPFR